MVACPWGCGVGGRAMRHWLGAAICFFFLLSGCTKVPLSPVQMVGDQQTNIAIEEFLYVSSQLANVYGLDYRYTKIQSRNITDSNPNSVLGFQLRADIPYDITLKVSGVPPLASADANSIRAYYIKAGAYASMLLCRNYLSGLRDRNEYFEYIQQQLGVAGGLATTTLSLVNANNALRTPVEMGLKGLNLSINEYEKFRFLSPDIETLIPLVEVAQTTLRDYYLDPKNAPTTFSGALDAVSHIEYQCTRSGIRGLLNKTLTQGMPQFDVKNGILYAKSPGTPQEGATSKK